jgi:hypothetical protein
MNHYHVRIYPPDHPAGVRGVWWWEVRSETEIYDCGKGEDQEDATERATSQLFDAMEAAESSE